MRRRGRNAARGSVIEAALVIGYGVTVWLKGIRLTT